MSHILFFLWFLVFSATLVALVLGIQSRRRQRPAWTRLHLLLLATLLAGILLRFLMAYAGLSGTRIPGGLFYPLKYGNDALLLYALMQLPAAVFLAPSRLRTLLHALLALSVAAGILLWPGPGYSLQRSLVYIYAAVNGVVTLFLSRKNRLPRRQHRSFTAAGLVCLGAVGIALAGNLLFPQMINRIEFFHFLLFALTWDIAVWFMPCPAAPETPAAILARLSPREREVCTLILRGLRNADIARTLYISPHTVKRHVASVCEKCGVASKLELLALLHTPETAAE